VDEAMLIAASCRACRVQQPGDDKHPADGIPERGIVHAPTPGKGIRSQADTRPLTPNTFEQRKRAGHGAPPFSCCNRYVWRGILLVFFRRFRPGALNLANARLQLAASAIAGLFVPLVRTRLFRDAAVHHDLFEPFQRRIDRLAGFDNNLSQMPSSFPDRFRV